MWPSLQLLSILLAVPVAVFACEGECIVGITHAFVGNYSNPIQSVLHEIDNQIIERIVPQHDGMSYLQPILTAYTNSSYDGMETAIFPSYFHGKCQVNGVDPKGCPNPDCPVVCGTPGSLVHFYPTLRFIAFNETREAMRLYTSSDSEAYRQVEHDVVRAAGKQARAAVPRFARYGDDVAGVMGENMPYVKKREESAKKALREILDEIPDLLAKACGGSAKDSVDGLPSCSWDAAMQEYILSFP
ncbi:hypothetical protein FA95DRAFT_1571363 [Auriscalpium vulgare]|uniref:Uncharacterized protein n=1 Tax=Auriscalpium vulgare TaxID=40419 RepID=A0ACB8RY73_9AGAM|nr:hypothetical protein FA95DRAFT_1571363 [Auriscalpium vulgare]